jgi:hypothetical protein
MYYLVLGLVMGSGGSRQSQAVFMRLCFLVVIAVALFPKYMAEEGLSGESCMHYQATEICRFYVVMVYTLACILRR